MLHTICAITSNMQAQENVWNYKEPYNDKCKNIYNIIINQKTWHFHHFIYENYNKIWAYKYCYNLFQV